MSVSVLLDGEESSLEFLDVHAEVSFFFKFPCPQRCFFLSRGWFVNCGFLSSNLQENIGGGFFDAFVFVYSVDDVTSFEAVEETMYHLRHDLGSDRPFILVANKIDLVRNRKVSPEGMSLYDSHKNSNRPALWCDKFPSPDNLW